MTTDTPRTDAKSVDHIGFYSCATVTSDFARQLERELAVSLQNQCKAQAEVERLKTLMHQTIWFVDDMIKTHANGCEHCFKKHGAMIALFKDITEEPQWPINPTDK
jgi:hypothetical protein